MFFEAVSCPCHGHGPGHQSKPVQAKKPSSAGHCHGPTTKVPERAVPIVRIPRIPGGQSPNLVCHAKIRRK
ncbi:hypothetical protein VTN49DRAFT_5001 [Thermomyces lanuginosus]|uniref:uncharacterized protein n=1 Tax=Thermomyces lanuginosus TaxID=5541 RepID=UPI00374349AB